MNNIIVRTTGKNTECSFDEKETGIDCLGYWEADCVDKWCISCTEFYKITTIVENRAIKELLKIGESVS